MGTFGSGDKNQTTTNEQLGASDNALLASDGSFIFVGSGYQRYQAVGVTEAVTQNPMTLALLAGVVVVAIYWLQQKK